MKEQLPLIFNLVLGDPQTVHSFFRPTPVPVFGVLDWAGSWEQLKCGLSGGT